jgi:carboxylesterase type B
MTVSTNRHNAIGIHIDFVEVIRDYLPGLNESSLNTLLDMYPVGEFTPGLNLTAEFYRSARIFRDVLMICPSLLLGEAVARTQSTPVYHYSFNQTVVGPLLDRMDNVSGLRVGHTSEFAYVFDSFGAYNASGLPVYPSQSDYDLMKRASRSWSTFVTQGSWSSQGHDTLQGWSPAYDSGKGPYIMTIGGPHEGLSAAWGPAKEKLEERCGFLNDPAIIAALGY